MIHSLIQLDKSWTLAINSLAGRWNTLDVVGVFASEYLIFILFFVTAAWGWYRVKHAGLGAAVIAAVMSQLFKRVISLFYFRQRPEIARLFNHLPYDASFPSGHSSGAFAMAFVVLLLSNGKSRFGWVLLAGAACVALGRVFEGMHYVSDVVAGIFFGWLSAWIGVKLVSAKFQVTNPK